MSLAGSPPLPAADSSSSPWECMLPGPPSRNNFGSVDISPSGLLAFPTGSSISVIDSSSLQHISTIPLPAPLSPSSASSTSVALSPFVTSVRWTPLPLRRDLLVTEPSSSHLILAAGDRHGRIGLVDFRHRSVLLWLDSDLSSKCGIQDLCWILSRPDSYVLAAISGPSTLSLYNTASGHCFFKYDATPEFLSCIRRDPFDPRQFCVIGLKGFLLSIKVLGEADDEVVVKELRIPNDCTEFLKLERDAAGGSSSSAPASAAFPRYSVKMTFSLQANHILFVSFPRELVVFDLQYETTLFNSLLPRGCPKFLNVLTDPNSDFLYCAHLDGKLSVWRRKEREQVHVMCVMEELMPSIGSCVPSPSLLAIAICTSESTLQNVVKLYRDAPDTPSSQDFNNHFDFSDEPLLLSKTHMISISDDGKVCNWLLTAQEIVEREVDVIPYAGDDANSIASADGINLERSKQQENMNASKGRLSSVSCEDHATVKICLVGQLQLLSSTLTMLAVPSPSLTATLARGGNYPAVAVPLVALGTQTGMIDIVDVSANAVAASFSVHTSSVRGLRWLGNSRLVSFSYNQTNEKSGGYANKLVVTCVRSGLNRPFRLLHKPERAPIRALRASSSGRYLLILFRDAPVEVWAMTKSPVMLRSLALPFTVLEWTLPTVPKPVQSGPSRQSSLNDSTPKASDGTRAPSDGPPTPKASLSESTVSSDTSQDEAAESFAFALVNGALGVFEVHGRKIRDFRPKWPSSSFVASDGLITAMAYRLPHVVMGDRTGNIRWWDVTTGSSSSFNTHREGIRRIKFSPVVPGDESRGRVAVLFYDNTFSVFDLDSPDPLANSLLQPQFPGTLVLELDWLPLRTEKHDPLVLCIAGADGSYRLLEVNMNDKRHGFRPPQSIKERFRPVPICTPILLPTPHALALRMILQLGVKPSWFNTSSTAIDRRPNSIPGVSSSEGDFRSYMIDLPPIGDSVVPEMLLKVLEPYRKEGCILDDEVAKLYATVVNKGCAVRFAFAAAIFGETAEALFWLQLPRALKHLMSKLVSKSPLKSAISATAAELEGAVMLTRITSREKALASIGDGDSSHGLLRLMAFQQEELWESANERIPWHEKLEGEAAIQNQVHELITVGNLETAVSLLLSTPAESSFFYPNALRAVALSSAVSKSLLELAVKVVAANMVRTDRSLAATHLLCAVGRHQEACSQLQDAGCWTDAATLAATHLKGSDYARVLQRWAGHVLHTEHNVWRALILYVAAGGLPEALAALREAQQPDTAAMFILACREIHGEILVANSEDEGGAKDVSGSNLPGLDPENEDVMVVGEYFGQYQRKLVHLCMDSQPYYD
ncbi:WD repeat-containing protein 11 [Linum grandiflorum]